MKKLIIPFALVANFLIVGCGGGSSYSYGDDDLPTPTAKLKQSQSQNIIETIHKTRLEPEYLLTYNSSESNSRKIDSLHKRLKVISADRDSIEACEEAGTKEIKVISGQSEDDTNATSGVYKYQIIYKDCKEYYEFTTNGAVDAIEEWTRDSSNTITYTGKYTTKNLIYKKDDKHKFVITDSLRINSGKYNNSSPNQEGTSNYTYSGKLINGDETLEFKNINHMLKFREIFKEHIMEIKDLYTYNTLSGAIYSSELNGWITIHTTTPYEKTEKDKVETETESAYCNHTGKLVIKGANHTITQEVSSDHSITEKFDNSTIKKYKNCIEYYK